MVKVQTVRNDINIWTYIRTAEFEIPAPLVTESAHIGIKQTWHRFKSFFFKAKKEKSEEFSAPDRPSPDLLQSASPELRWNYASDALMTEWAEWLANPQSDPNIRVVIGPPGCEVSEVLQSLARERQLETLSTPEPDAILQHSASSVWQAFDESSSDILVIPHLEHCFLRHAEGLSLLRKLLKQLVNCRRRVLIGCDSWAWAFLQHAVGIEDTLGEPLTLAPFDANRLNAFLRSNAKLQQFEFRLRGDDKAIFTNSTDTDDAGQEQANQEQANQKQAKVDVSPLVKSLATRSRGNLAVALALWQAALRTRDASADEADPAALASQTVLWIVPPSELSLPGLPSDVDRVHRFILHALLIHGGLPLSTLVAVVPFATDEVHQHALSLCRAGIVEEHNARLRVSLSAYLGVRYDLHNQDFMTDSF